MQFSQIQLKILQIVSGGAIGLGILFTLVGAFAFNSEEFIHDDKLGMEFGMELDLTTQVTSVWIRVPQVLQIKTMMKNVYKIDEDGVQSPGGLGDLFPVTGPTRGAIEAQIEILAADDDQMPDLSTRDQSVKPMGYMSEKSKPTLSRRYSLIAFAWAIKHWGIIKLAIYGEAIAMIIIGIVMRLMNKKKIEADLVVELKVEPASATLAPVYIK